MNSRIHKLEPWLYGLALVLALVVRFASLGRVPLGDYEASLALQSLDSLRSQHTLIGSQTGYVQLTTLLFYLFGPGNSIARFIPALLGSLVVVAPVLFRRWLGRTPAVVLAFFLAFDPGLVGLSRQAGTPILGLAGAVLAWGFWRIGKPELSGVALGLALMGGEGFWSGLIGLGIALFAAWRLGWLCPEEPEEASQAQSVFPSGRFTRLGLFAAGTVIIIGSLFFLRPHGLNGVVESLSVYLQGWWKPSDVSGLKLVVALLAYQTGALLFGIPGAIRGWRTHHGVDKFLSLWALVGFLAALVYPAHQVSDLAWVILPLWALAAREVIHYFPAHLRDLYPVLGQAVLVFIVLVFGALQLAALTDNTLAQEIRQVYALSMGGALVFLGLTSFLITWGWSIRVAGRGLAWGAGCFLLLYTITTMTGAAALRSAPTAELWDRDARVTYGTLLVQTIDDLSRWHGGFPDSLDVVVSGIQSPSLRWALRNYASTQFVDRLPVGLNPAVVITAQQQPELAAAYRGQSLVWSQTPEWSLMLPAEYLPWLVYHAAPEQENRMYLWVRTDIFPGGLITIPESTTP